MEVISDYVTLKKAGRNYSGLCPFHGEKTPSFTVSEEKGIFHCFGCQTGGSVFHFLMKYDQLSFPEAVERVAKRYGIEIERSDARGPGESLCIALMSVPQPITIRSCCSSLPDKKLWII